MSTLYLVGDEVGIPVGVGIGADVGGVVGFGIGTEEGSCLISLPQAVMNVTTAPPSNKFCSNPSEWTGFRVQLRHSGYKRHFARLFSSGMDSFQVAASSTRKHDPKGPVQNRGEYPF